VTYLLVQYSGYCCGHGRHDFFCFSFFFLVWEGLGRGRICAVVATQTQSEWSPRGEALFSFILFFWVGILGCEAFVLWYDAKSKRVESIQGNLQSPLFLWLGGVSGGDAFVLWYDAKSKRVESIQGNGRSPQALTLDLVTGAAGTPPCCPSSHALTVTVPGAAACWVDTVGSMGA